MNITVIMGSQRSIGMHMDIEEGIRKLDFDYEYDFIRMSEVRIEACIACEDCTNTGRCVLPESNADHFNDIYRKLQKADAIFIITPIYAPIPSRLTALLERLLSISFFSHEIGNLDKQLEGKKTAIFCYDSSKIGDETQLKLIFQRFLMNGYSFDKVDYEYLNSEANPNDKYNNVCEYVLDTIRLL